MIPLNEAIENLRMARAAKQAMIDRVIADADAQFAYIIARRTQEYEDALRRAMNERER